MTEREKPLTATIEEKSKTVKRRVYEEPFKRRVVECLLQEGNNLSQVSRLYNVSRTVIRYWVKQYSCQLVVSKAIQMTPEEEKELDSIKRQNQDMYKSLQEAQLKISGLETLINVAEKEFKIDIRKKSGSKPSKS